MKTCSLQRFSSILIQFRSVIFTLTFTKNNSSRTSNDITAMLKLKESKQSLKNVLHYHTCLRIVTGLKTIVNFYIHHYQIMEVILI